MPSPAALPRFDLTLDGRDDFSVYAFNGREAVSEPYEFQLELIHRHAGLKLTPFIGAPARLVIWDISGTPRYVHGLVREMRRLHKGNVFTHYQCILVPRFWFLSQNRNHRIFQQASVPDIIRQILEQQGFAPETFAFKCFAKYAPREYCVQYAESDLHFLSRLCEEEGIYYYFEHTADGQCLCFSDMPGGPDIPGGSPLLYRFAAGMRGDAAVFSDVRYHVAARGNAVAFREWNFEKYWTTLPVSADEPDQQAAPVPPGMLLEDYRYPHLYQLTEAGQNYAKIQLQRGLTFSRWIEGNADVARLLPGFTFALARHPRPELNDRWWVTACLHRGEQPQALEHEAPERGAIYSATCQAIPATTRFVPAERHPKVRIPCKQTALVAGPKQEDIHTDKYGRVKLRFFWDRRDTEDENASCWVRVAQGWAGPGYGCMAIPRIGQEVIVSFLEGDPDRPLVTGRVYNGATPRRMNCRPIKPVRSCAAAPLPAKRAPPASTSCIWRTRGAGKRSSFRRRRTRICTSRTTGRSISSTTGTARWTAPPFSARERKRANACTASDGPSFSPTTTLPCMATATATSPDHGWARRGANCILSPASRSSWKPARSSRSGSPGRAWC